MFAKFLTAFGRHGLLGVVRRVPEFVYWRYRYEVDHARWDRQWGTETTLTEKEYLSALPCSEVVDAEFYEPVAGRWFLPMMRAVPVVSRDCSFVDLGSGKGRALFFAAKYGFRRVIGVEFSEFLHGIAVSNSANFSVRQNAVPIVELVRADASAFVFPDGPLVIYMYNPFRGELMRSVVARIAQHAIGTDAPVYVIYKQPECAKMFDENGGFETVLAQRASRSWFSPAEPFIVYRAGRG